ncbi:MAG TPA: 4'-phosphopantetheinyl transferase superfamily protein [Saprospiraceae bacterium]|nr:4'-phosphopantetheinyl transferase superfamily protein [Saprospiraceae bacterium]HQW56849.1 4'-phosphopantetheinyl transferase superfamily protein [Saprospiraceae bacterium]
MPAIEIPVLNENLDLQLWEISEPLNFFLQRTKLSALEHDEITLLSGKRQLEYVVQRYLLQMHSVDRVLPHMMKTKNGKPVLINNPDHISITHSGSLLALSRGSSPHGIDLEHIDPRIIRLAEKFCNASEVVAPSFCNEVLWYTLIWSCKEALYKVDGLGGLDFRKSIATYFTAVSIKKGSGRGMVRRDEQIFYFHLSFEIIGDYVLTVAYPMDKY